MISVSKLHILILFKTSEYTNSSEQFQQYHKRNFQHGWNLHCRKVFAPCDWYFCANVVTFTSIIFYQSLAQSVTKLKFY